MSHDSIEISIRTALVNCSIHSLMFVLLVLSPIYCTQHLLYFAQLKFYHAYCLSEYYHNLVVTLLGELEKRPQNDFGKNRRKFQQLLGSNRVS